MKKMKLHITRSRALVIASISVFGLFVGLSAYYSYTWSEWDYERIAWTNNYLGINQILMDSSDTPHFLYYSSAGSLVYGNGTGDAAVRLPLIGLMSSESFYTMVLDSRGNPHVAVTSRYGDMITYFTCADGTWRNTSFLPFGEPSSAAIVVDGNNTVHIFTTLEAFGTETTSRRLVDFRPSRDEWDQTVIKDFGIEFPWIASASIDSRGAAHILTYSSGYGDASTWPANKWSLTYGTNRTGAWSFDRIVESNAPLGRPSMYVEPSGIPHISFYYSQDAPWTFETVYHVMHGSKSDGNWSFVEVADGGNYEAGSSSIAVDSSGIVHIAYTYYWANEKSGESGNSMRYARIGDREISHSVVDKSIGGMPGWCPCSIAADSEGTANLLYVAPEGMSLAFQTYANNRERPGAALEPFVDALKSTAYMVAGGVVIGTAIYIGALALLRTRRKREEKEKQLQEELSLFDR